MKAFKKIKCSLKVLKKIKCPCCGYYTIEDYGEEVNCNICPVCFWQYDVVGQDNPNDIVGGPNGKLSLNQARDNYKKFGVAVRIWCHMLENQIEKKLILEMQISIKFYNCG